MAGLNSDANYPDCPHCDSTGFVQCACGKIGYAGGLKEYGDSGEYTCP